MSFIPYLILWIIPAVTAMPVWWAMAKRSIDLEWCDILCWTERGWGRTFLLTLPLILLPTPYGLIMTLVNGWAAGCGLMNIITVWRWQRMLAANETDASRDPACSQRSAVRQDNDSNPPRPHHPTHTS